MASETLEADSHGLPIRRNVALLSAAPAGGMYALVIVVGDLVDRIGRAQSLSGGLLLMGLSVSCLLWARSPHATAAALFGLGLGWNLSFMAATAELTVRAEAWERGRLLGFNDLLSGATGAALTLLGGLALTGAGVAALAIGAGPGRRPRALDPAGRDRAATLRAVHKRLPKEDTMRLTKILRAAR
jgi:MFS family permease